MDMLVNVVSCISQYYGPRCEYVENLSEETRSIEDGCTNGCDSFLGRLVLFSTLGALLTLLMLLVLCLFVKRKFHPNRPRYSSRTPEIMAPTPIPMSIYDAASVQGPGSVSRVYSPTRHPNSYVEPPRALEWMQSFQSVINNYSSASDSTSHLFSSDFPPAPDCLPFTNRHLPQIRSLTFPN
nr:expressed protein [Hymenolepis microstoma]